MAPLPLPDDDDTTVYVTVHQLSSAAVATETIGSNSNLTSTNLVPTSSSASSVTAAPLATATTGASGGSTLFLHAPGALFRSNANWTCSDEAQLSIGGGVSPYTISLVNGSLPIPASAMDISAVALGSYGSFIAAGKQDVGLNEPVGSMLRFALVDATDAFVISPVLVMQDGSGHCSYNSASWASRHKADIVIFSLFGVPALISLLVILASVYYCIADSCYWSRRNRQARARAAKPFVAPVIAPRVVLPMLPRKAGVERSTDN